MSFWLETCYHVGLEEASHHVVSHHDEEATGQETKDGFQLIASKELNVFSV